jgi:hypothetical protein
MSQSRPFNRSILSAIALAFCASGTARAGFDEDVEKALNLGGGEYGKVNFDARYRYEYVDQDFGVVPLGGTSRLNRSAHASTLRVRLGYLTPEFQGFKGFVEYEGNQDIGVNDYYSTTNGNGAARGGKDIYPVVADPQANEVNQLWIGYSGLPQTHVKVGRQRIIFDNHRFIGNVIWRQLEQTYDAVTIANTSLPDTTIVAGYIWKVQDITSRTRGMNSPIFNIAYTGLPFGKLIIHGEWLDFDNNDEQARLPPGFGNAGTFRNSTQTVGARFDGAYPVMDKVKALYTAEYAWQEDHAENPRDFKVDYWLAEAGLDVYGVTFKAAYEELGADNGQGFRTPLATLHAFQGWADKFLVTPKDGIRDMYGTLKTNLFGIDWMAVYHEFSSANDHQDYGHEINLQAEKKFGKHYSILVKYADYEADGFATDTEKFWVQGSVNF